MAPSYQLEEERASHRAQVKDLRHDFGDRERSLKEQHSERLDELRRVTMHNPRSPVRHAGCHHTLRHCGYSLHVQALADQTQRSADEIEARAARDHKFYAEQESTLKERTKSEREALLSVG